jgi:hypothetical protein
MPDNMGIVDLIQSKLSLYLSGQMHQMFGQRLGLGWRRVIYARQLVSESPKWIGEKALRLLIRLLWSFISTSIKSRGDCLKRLSATLMHICSAVNTLHATLEGVE